MNIPRLLKYILAQTIFWVVILFGIAIIKHSVSEFSLSADIGSTVLLSTVVWVLLKVIVDAKKFVWEDSVREHADSAYTGMLTTHGIDLFRANLANSDLRSVNWQEANLIEANLRAANLKAANLSGANLLEANLKNADLQYTRIIACIVRVMSVYSCKNRGMGYTFSRRKKKN